MPVVQTNRSTSAVEMMPSKRPLSARATRSGLRSQCSSRKVSSATGASVCSSAEGSRLGVRVAAVVAWVSAVISDIACIRLVACIVTRI